MIERTLAEVEPLSDRVACHFYAVLFTECPQLRPLFPAAMDVQRERLTGALFRAARLAAAGDRPALQRFLTPLGRGHRRFGALPEHYPALGRALLAALARYAVATWDDTARDTWAEVYATVADTMIRAAEEAEGAGTPPWWQAEITAHRRCGPDAALLTLRPDHPYPFRAGQYLTLETPWWPRAWRSYSPAAAPRPDNSLDLLVKAVSGGWVSRALVHRAVPGDRLRLGAAEGGLAIDPDATDPVLCLAGGTGVAPVKALTEDLAERTPRRRVELYYGARSLRELYVLGELEELARRCPWLTVRPVVSGGGHAGAAVPGGADGYPGPVPLTGGPSGGGAVRGERGAEPVTYGQLPDAVRTRAPFPGTDVVLSGPPAMLRRSVAMLLGQGVPAGRISHDPVEEMDAAAGPGAW